MLCWIQKPGENPSEDQNKGTNLLGKNSDSDPWLKNTHTSMESIYKIMKMVKISLCYCFPLVETISPKSGSTVFTSIPLNKESLISHFSYSLYLDILLTLLPRSSIWTSTLHTKQFTLFLFVDHTTCFLLIHSLLLLHSIFWKQYHFSFLISIFTTRYAVTSEDLELGAMQALKTVWQTTVLPSSDAYEPH